MRDTQCAGDAPHQRVIAADRLVKLPDPIDFKTAAAMMLQGMTAQYLIRRTYAVKSGDTIQNTSVKKSERISHIYRLMGDRRERLEEGREQFPIQRWSWRASNGRFGRRPGAGQRGAPLSLRAYNARQPNPRCGGRSWWLSSG